MDIWLILMSSLIGYFIGSISFSRIFLKLLAPGKSINDIQLELDDSQETIEVKMGSGANKASIILGSKWGVIIGILDMMKVIIPLIIFRYFLFPEEPYFLYVAAFGLIGHNWPIYHRFNGGRGQSVMLGSLIIIDWPAVVFTLIFSNLIGFALFGSLIIAFYLWLWMLIPWFLLSTFDINFILYAIIVNIILILGQIPEIKLYLQLHKQGKALEYKERLLEMTAQLRGMKKIENFFKSLGKWRVLISIASLIGTLIIYFLLPLTS